MTPKEKAEELLDKMSIQTYRYQEYAGARYSTDEVGYEAGKKCALIAVDNIITENWIVSSPEKLLERRNYWQEVKQEIEKL